MYSDVEMMELEEDLRKILPERLEGILSRLNRTNELDTLMRLLGLTGLLGKNTELEFPKDGKIIVIGQSDVSEQILVGVAKKMGLRKERFEFCLEYNVAVKYDFRKAQYSSRYSCILVGPMPHSGWAKDDYSSIITALEQQKGYPPIYRLGTNNLKITKTSFSKTLEDLIEEGILAA